MDLLALANELMSEAERLYGPRAPGWKLLSVEVAERATPCTWFPERGGTVRIMLARNVRGGDRRAGMELLYQLAHECVHLLQPTNVEELLVTLEEGLAKVYAEQRVEAEYGVHHYGRWNDGNPRRLAYCAAADAVDELLALHPAAIPNLRALEPAFNRLTAQHFAQAAPKASPALVGELLAPFAY